MASRKDKEALGAYIKNLREKKGFSLDQVCEGLCTSQQLSKLEKGERRRPNYCRMPYWNGWG